MLMRKIVPHFVTCFHGYYTTKLFIKTVIIYKSGDQHVNILTDNDFNKLHFVVTFLNPTYYICLMLSTTYCAQTYAGIIGLGLPLSLYMYL